MFVIAEKHDRSIKVEYKVRKIEFFVLCYWMVRNELYALYEV